jgi:hypothetical protein
MKKKFEAVRDADGWAVKTQIRKGGRWYTAVDSFCIPGFLDAKGIAEATAKTLNAIAERK